MSKLTDDERAELTRLANLALDREPMTYTEYVRFVTLTNGTPSRTQYAAYCAYIEPHTKGQLLHIGRDVVHPETGEVLAEAGDVCRLPDPVGEHVIAVAKAHPHTYLVVANERYIVITERVILEEDYD